MARIFSGIQPSGELHVGNYLGAVKNWVALQGTMESIFCIVDLHAITVPYDPALLRVRRREMAIGLLAAGIDPERASLFVLHHHERMDGKGYPAGLAGEDIPLGARIVAVVDAFDAMVSNRSYRQGLPVEEAMRRLRADSGTQFDPKIVESFVRLAVQELPEVSQIVEPRLVTQFVP